MLRRHIITSVMFTLVIAVFFGLAYPFAVTGVGRLVFPWRSDGSFITRNGHVVASALIGQEYLDNKGNPDPRYFQPRPSAAGNGYDATSSGASNLGPQDPRLVGFIPGLNTLDLHGQKYAKNSDGSFACYSSTVPERASAYRALNNLAADVKVPVDTVTASASGLDPDISEANANLQVERVAAARKVPVAVVVGLVKRHENNYQWGFLGEKTVNVVNLNLALDGLP